MCGRFTLHHTWRELWELYRLSDADAGRNDAARYNIAPTEAVIALCGGGARAAVRRCSMKCVRK